MGQIWAVARNLIVEVWRMRALMVFVILMIAFCTVGFAFWLHGGSDSIDQKIQTFLSYSLSFVFNIFALLTIFISIATITRDIKRKEIHTITTKPISRGSFLVGKLLGLALLNLIFLSITGGLIYGMAYILPRAKTYNAAEMSRLNELVFNARRSVTPPLPDIADKVREEVEKKVKENIQTDNITDPDAIKAMRKALTADLTRQIALRYRAVAPGSHILWHFSGIEPVDREKGTIYVRYKQEVSPTPPSLAINGKWSVGPRPDALSSDDQYPKRNSIRTVHEFPIPVSAISEGGDLYVEYRNPPENRVVVIYPTDVTDKHFGASIEVLYEAGGFTGNFLRALGVLYLQLLFLSVLSLAVGAWLSYPVAVLLVMVVFLAGMSSDFILEAVDWIGAGFSTTVSRLILPLFPRFASYDPVPQIEIGRYVSYLMLLKCLFKMVLLKGGVVGLFGYLIFKFRELARVIV